MKKNKAINNEVTNKSTGESGQTLVLIALLFVILLLFVGLAVDVGFGFVRSSQFSRSVDAAVLAGVIDLNPATSQTTEADIRAAQFLAANGWPTSTLTLFQSSRSTTEGGIPQYTITATWPVETYFIHLLGIGGFPITHSASAAYFTNSELYTPTGFDHGIISKANLFVIGEEGCSSLGDPVIPLNYKPGEPNEGYPSYDGLYRFRINIPARYPLTTGVNEVYVELFDPDSVNPLDRANNAGIQVTHSDAYGGFVEDMSCVTAGWGDRCIVYTNEDPYAVFQNPYWLWRVDRHYDSSCNLVNDGYGDTATVYELFYANAEGRRVTVATYAVNNEDDAAYTDLNWVSPGVDAGVPTVDGGQFMVDLNLDPIPQAEDGSYSIYLDVRAPFGSSMNVFDIWAGPPDSYYTGLGLAPPETNANMRNLQLVENPVGYGSAGISIYALGRLPLQYFADASLGDNFDDVTLPLMLLDIDLVDQTIYGTAYDYNPEDSQKNVEFFVDTVDRSWYNIDVDLVDPGNVDTHCIPDEEGRALLNLKTSCETALDWNGTCTGEWLQPQFQLCVPRSNFFGGGILQAILEPDGDAHTWQFSVTAGDPFLTK